MTKNYLLFQFANFAFRGLMPPVLTPFNADFSLNLSVIPKYVDFLYKQGIKGILGKLLYIRFPFLFYLTSMGHIATANCYSHMKLNELADLISYPNLICNKNNTLSCILLYLKKTR